MRPALPLAAVSVGQMIGDWRAGATLLGVLFMVVFALVLAALVYAVVRLVLVPVVEGTDGAVAGGSPRDGGEPAVGILRERFARGEIDEEEFERRRAVLRDREP